MDAYITGEFRQPTNTAADQKGGIHDDATATDLGFRGGTVAGAIHMEQFPPLLVQLFGDDWWRSGTLSLYFKSATIDGEPVRCFVGKPEQSGSVQRTTVWMEKEDGTLVMSGTAACGGHDGESELQGRLAAIRPAGELRILESLSVGAQASLPGCSVADAYVDAQLRVITEPFSGYENAAKFGGRVLPITQLVRGFDPVEQVLVQTVPKPFVGLYGAIEIEYINGPALSETPYTVNGEIVGLSDSPQTEILWRELVMKQNDQPVARMLKMDRLMKNSSPLWTDPQ